jgi:hypothetical protein
LEKKKGGLSSEGEGLTFNGFVDGFNSVRVKSASWCFSFSHGSSSVLTNKVMHKDKKENVAERR